MLPFVVDEYAINAGLRILLMTEPGERLNEPDFGVMLRDLLFEQESPGLQDEVIRRINAGIERFEQRIVLVAPGVSVEVQEENDTAPTGAVYLGVSFRWAFKNNLAAKFDFSETLFRRDPIARRAFLAATQG